MKNEIKEMLNGSRQFRILIERKLDESAVDTVAGYLVDAFNAVEREPRFRAVEWAIIGADENATELASWEDEGEYFDYFVNSLEAGVTNYFYSFEA